MKVSQTIAIVCASVAASSVITTLGHQHPSNAVADPSQPLTQCTGSSARALAEKVRSYKPRTIIARGERSEVELYLCK